MFVLLATVAAIALTGADSGQVSGCALRKPGASMMAFVAMPAVKARDTVVTAAVCVVDAKTGSAKVASYHGELYFDSTAARVVRVDKPRDGMRVENTTLAGRVNFAGAAPTGFAPGALLSVVLRVKQAGVAPKLRLKMLELNAVDGSNLLKQLVVASP